jgi:hypothetical protein
MPQPPQLALSVKKSTHVAPQQVSLPGHGPPHAGGTHLLPAQGSLTGQVMPQPPQLEWSDVVTTHVPEQHVAPRAQSLEVVHFPASAASWASLASCASLASWASLAS